MIHSLKVLDGFPLKLEGVGKRTFEFKPGLNILFGPNGCGKTTLIRILGAYSATQAGWSRYVAPSLFRGAEDYPEILAKNTPGGCKAEVAWDGTASFLMSPQTGDFPGSAIGDSEDGLMSTELLVGEMMLKASSGQSRIMRVKRLLEMAKSVPDLTKRPENYDNVNDVWQKAMDRFVAYVKELPRKGAATLLLDEIDQSMSIPLQLQFWELMEKISKTFQVVIATHSLFALKYHEKMMEFVPGYVNESVEALRILLKE